MAIITVVPGTDAIQNAVNAASPGDVILVNNGVYNETVAITTDNIRIMAASTQVFLDGTNTGTAFFLNGVTGGEINGFNIANYASGIVLFNNSNFNLITRNKIKNVSNAGINMFSGTGNLILSNTVEKTGNNLGDASIDVGDTSNWVVNNTVRGNFGIGVLLQDFEDSYGVIGNTIFNNGGIGLEVLSASDFNIIESNTITANKNNGLVLRAAANENFIFKNTIRSNQPNNIVNHGTDNNFLQNR